MDNHLGLAFTAEQLCFAYFTKHEDSFVLDQLLAVAYPVSYQELKFYHEDNVPAIADTISKITKEHQIDLSNISVTIESNLALLKRITIPPNLDEPGKKDHINWDLSESLTLPISDYVYFRSPNQYKFKSFEEELVIAVPKKVVHFFRSVTNSLTATLVNLSINHLAVELLIQNSLENQLEKLMVLQKIAFNRVETTYLWNGSYFASHYDQLAKSEEVTPYINLVKSKISYIENIFEQYAEDKTLVDRVLIYGDLANDEFIDKMQKNMSVPVDRVNTLQNINLSKNFNNASISEEENARYVECVGVTLDI